MVNPSVEYYNAIMEVHELEEEAKMPITCEEESRIMGEHIQGFIEAMADLQRHELGREEINKMILQNFYNPLSRYRREHHGRPPELIVVSVDLLVAYQEALMLIALMEHEKWDDDDMPVGRAKYLGIPVYCEDEILNTT